MDDRGNAKRYSKVHYVDNDAPTVASALASLAREVASWPRELHANIAVAHDSSEVSGLVRIEMWSTER